MNSTNQIEIRKPPVASTGVVGWLRMNLFSSWFNTIVTILVLGFIINTIIYNLDSIKIQKNIDKFFGSITGIIRGTLVINILIIIFQLFPIHESSKTNILSKFNQESILFNFIDKIRSILID